ncbi:hypothetical protein FQN52_003013 [Onygenales sp. PD_12]|nr:hypothetical protein FQN52_003013 [Onygenales sp. PD_12]
MTSPVSIGDAILLSKIAFRLGQAFTTGRRSAPAEFQEVQNQLYALSKALQFLQTHRLDTSKSEDDPITGAQDAGKRPDVDENAHLALMVNNCRSTLVHLESLVDKYTVIADDGGESSKSRRWRAEILTNWKKIQWTTEGGDLAKLRSNLDTQINSINLSVSALNRNLSGISGSSTQRIEDRVNAIHNMLDEVHQWFTKNVKQTKPVPTAPEQNSGLEEQDPPLTFSVSIEQADGWNPLLICPRASFKAGWLDETGLSVTPGLLQCHCQRNDPSHHVQLQFSLCPISLLIRRASKPQIWQLSVVPPNTSEVITLLLKGIPGARNKELYDFEQETNNAAFLLARQYLRLGLSSMLAYRAQDANSRPVYSVLNSASKTSHLVNQISGVTFKANNHKFDLAALGDLKLLHYKTFQIEDLKSLSTRVPTEYNYQNVAELILEPAMQGALFSDAGPARYIVKFDRNTQIDYGNVENTVSLSKAHCVAEYDNAEPNNNIYMDVGVEFSTHTTAAQFLESLLSMQYELTVYSLRLPRPSEKVLFQVDTPEVMVQHYRLSNATITLFFDSSENAYRILFRNEHGSHYISIGLPQAFFQELKWRPGMAINLGYPTYFVRMDDEIGAMIEERPSGITLLIFSDEEAQQLLYVLLQSVADGV